jgi:serine/threonine protein kinase
MTSLLPEQNLIVEWDRDDFHPNIYNESIGRLELNHIVEQQILGSKLCSIQLDNPPDAPFEIIKRIGTESNDGEIYLVKLQDTDFHAVFKIIPYKNEHTREVFLNELAIAKICSNMVKQQQCGFFPIMYTSYECNNLIFPESSLLYKIAFRYEILKDTFEKLKLLLDGSYLSEVEKLKQDLHFQLGMMDDFIKMKSIMLESIQQFLKERNIIADITIDVRIKGFVLVNELGQMDLSQFIYYRKSIKQKILDSEWIHIIDDILNGIKCLQLNNILHNDLHMVMYYC